LKVLTLVIDSKEEEAHQADVLNVQAGNFDVPQSYEWFLIENVQRLDINNGNCVKVRSTFLVYYC
jgi:hypothetical protein